MEVRFIHAVAFRCSSPHIERGHSTGTGHATRGEPIKLIGSFQCIRQLQKKSALVKKKIDKCIGRNIFHNIGFEECLHGSFEVEKYIE